MKNDRAVITTQATSKNLKLNILISSIIMVLGFLILLMGGGFGAIIIFIGFIYYFITRVCMWWSHG